MTQEGEFWVEDPCILVSDVVFFPTAKMTRAEKLNALTRLALAISVVMYFMKYKYWFHFAVLSVLFGVILFYSCKPKDNKQSDEGPKTPGENQIENFTVVPTYVGTDFQQTTVAPTFAEEWQVPPPAYDLYTQVPYPGPASDTFETPLQPQSYPYGQYLTKTNLLPSDEYYTHLGCGGAKSAREYVNSTFLRHDLAFRDNMTRIYKKSLNRRFRHNSGANDTVSPFYSY